MNFIEFKDKFFEGNEEKAIECIAKEKNEGFQLIQDNIQLSKIIISFTEEQFKQYQKFSKRYNILDLKALMNCESEYRSKRKVMIFLTIFLIGFWCLVLLPLKVASWLYIVPPIVVVAFLCMWIFKRNREKKPFHTGEFYIKRAVVSSKEVKDDRGCEGPTSYYYYIYFEGYEKFEITDEHEYDRIKCGDEYFLLILGKNKNQIEKIFSSDIYELSDEFRLVGDKYTL